MAMKKKPGRKSGGTTVNFSGVESGGRKCPDGEYLAEITSAEIEESSAGNPMIVAKWKIATGKFKGTTLFDNISLTPQALWKLKTLLEALGIEPEEDDKDAEEYAAAMLEQQATIIVTNETYEGEQRPKVTGYGTTEGGEAEEEPEAEEEEEEEEKPVKKGAAKKKVVAADDDDDDAEEEEEEEEEEEPKVRNKKTVSKVKEGSRVKFDDGEGTIVKGTVTSLDKGKATVEDKAGDEYEVDAEDLTLL